MKVLILNSGMGTRMGIKTSCMPKCLTQISSEDTILGRQLKIISANGIKDVVITTGFFDNKIIEYSLNLKLPLNFTFVKNQLYERTNYIYSIYCAREYLDDDIILIHGDLVFESSVLKEILLCRNSCMAVSSVIPLPEKDFKAVLSNGLISKIGIECFDNSVAAYPLYKLIKEDWKIWQKSIENFCKNGNVNVYAENAFNVVSEKFSLFPFDIKNYLCGEIDNQEDYNFIVRKLKMLK